MATWKENKEFSESILPQYPLDEAITWIESNLEPEDVFSENKLGVWALYHGFVRKEAHE